MLARQLGCICDGLSSALLGTVARPRDGGQALLPVVRAIFAGPCPGTSQAGRADEVCPSGHSQSKAAEDAWQSSAARPLGLQAPLRMLACKQAQPGRHLTLMQERLFSSRSASSSSQALDQSTGFASTLDDDGLDDDDQAPSHGASTQRRVPNFYVGLDNLRDNPGARREVG